ncbi:hypothetical protein E2C01_074267 [Portunus trituberculatus]|uniref:Uncharacterized protein n=1 Tax=Portunus trituberculatus TaxID=210409 RepID=A0A5B7IBQ3_PORTR|nr:hypothetical protein [Portunus trituberculatus]
MTALPALLALNSGMAGWQGGRGKGHVQGGGLLAHIRHTLLTARLHTATQNGITGLARRQPQCREVPHPPHPKVSLGLTVKTLVYRCCSVWEWLRTDDASRNNTLCYEMPPEQNTLRREAAVPHFFDRPLFNKCWFTF